MIKFLADLFFREAFRKAGASRLYKPTKSYVKNKIYEQPRRLSNAAKLSGGKKVSSNSVQDITQNQIKEFIRLQKRVLSLPSKNVKNSNLNREFYIRQKTDKSVYVVVKKPFLKIKVKDITRGNFNLIKSELLPLVQSEERLSKINK